MSGGRAVVVGLGVAGEASARRLAERGWTVTVIEERPGEQSRGRAAELASRGVTTVETPPPAVLTELVGQADLLVPSPGVPAAHPAVAAALATGTDVWSEFELAAEWSSVPLVAVTGTNGKTTVTTLVERMLTESGRRTLAAGNNDVPLVDAIALEPQPDVVVVEASSFRLEFTRRFHPLVAAWLNHAEDHLDWHGTMERYAAAKARVWAAQEPDDVAVANAEDPVVMRAAGEVRSRLTTFGLEVGDWRVAEGRLLLPDGGTLVAVEELWRRLPHDLTNALAAAAVASAAGASLEAIRHVLRTFRGLPHRVCLVAEHDGIRYYDDSKATDPHAAAAAVGGFTSVVLIAGGRNKGLDLSALAAHADRLRAVVAIGEAAGEIEAALTGAVPVRRATTMDDAVVAARSAASAGDVVLLSPGCASYDWYSSYAERGDDFARAVLQSLGAQP